MAERTDVRITVSAHNHGNKTVDPNLNNIRLKVNGKESFYWDMTIGNGMRETKWHALPPGDSVSMTWSSSGESLFPEAGAYVLQPFHPDFTFPELRIQVNS